MDRSPLFDTFARAPIAFERGEGAWLTTTDGRRMLDFSSGVAVNVLGHAHPALVGALKAQAEKVWHVSNLYRIPEQEKFAETLCAATFADKVFFGNSGAEAVECALKTARRYHFVNGHPERVRIITFAGAFHGRTLATLAATGNPKYLEGYGPPAHGFDQVELGDLKAVEAKIGPETAAILIEPIQGEGGIRLVPGPFLRALRELCDRHGLLLIFDEVQTGIGRTGKLFAYEWSGVTSRHHDRGQGARRRLPGRRLPCHRGSREGHDRRAPTARPSAAIRSPWRSARRCSTCCSPTASSTRSGGKASTSSSGSPRWSIPIPTLSIEVRGEGLLVGVRCKVPVAEVNAAMRDEDMLGVGAGENVIRLLPPLIVSDAEIDEGVRRFDAALTALDHAKAKAG